MKKLLLFIFVLLCINGLKAQFFQQQFGTDLTTFSNTNSSDATYVNSSSPSNSQITYWSTNAATATFGVASGVMNMTRPGTGTTYWIRNVDFSSTTSLMVRFDYNVTAASGTSTSAVTWYAGDGFSNANSTPSTAHSTFNLAISSTTGPAWRPNTSGTGITGVATVLWVINNSGSTMTYKAPDGTYESVANDTWDVWAGSTKYQNDIAAASAGTALANIAFRSAGGNGSHIFDNILVDPIPAAVTSNTASDLTASSFRANWTAISGVTGYRVDVSTASDFSSFVPGYENVYVSGAATNYLDITGLSASTAYYYRVRAASQYTVGEFAGGNSASQNPTTLSGSSPTITTNLTGFNSAFGNVVNGSNSAEDDYTVSGSNLTDDIIINAPSGFQVSKDGAGVGFGSSVTLTQSGGTVNATTIYVRYSPSTATGATGSLNIANTSTGATTQNVSVNGKALDTEPSTTGSISFGTVTGGTIVVNLPTTGNGDKRIIVVRQGSAVSYTPTDGDASTGVNANFSSASDQGSGNKIVYDGTGSGSGVVTVSGLAHSTTYHFAVYEYNEGTGASQNYFTSAVTGSQATSLGSNSTDHFRSKNSGDWATTATWESSTTGSDPWIDASLSPDNNAAAIEVRSTHIVTISTAITTGTTAINGEVDITTGTLTIAASKTVTVNGTLDNANMSTSAITVTGSLSFSSGANYRLSGSGTTGLVPNATWHSNSNIYLNGTFTASTSLTNTIGAVYGNYFITGSITGTLVPFANQARQRIAGNFTISPTGTGVVQLISSGATNILPIDGNYSQTSGIVLMNPSSFGATTFRPMVVKGNFNLENCTFRISSNTANCYLILKGNFNANNVTLENTGIAGSGAAYIHFAGNGAQTYSWTGTRSIAAATNGINFVINSGTILDMADYIIDGGALVTFTQSGAYTAPALTGTTAVASNSITSITGGTTGMQPGMLISGTGILADTYITAVVSGTELQISKPATAAGSVSLTVSSLAEATLKTSSATGVNGNIQNSGSQTFASGTSYEFYGTAMSAVTGSLMPATINNLTFNNSNGVTLSSAATINNLLTVTTGTLTTGSNNLTLNSSTGSAVIEATGALNISGGTTDFNSRSVTFKSSATGTARLDNVVGTLLDATNVTVERYIPNTGRKWRFLTAPLSGASNNTVFANWQNNGTVTAGRGVSIWGTSGTCDPGVTVGNGLVPGPGAGSPSSMRKYNNTANNWTNILNTNTEVLFDAGGNKAFALFVTGHFGGAFTTVAQGSAATTLAATGSLITGSKAFNFTYEDNAEHIAMIGNPYASPVNFFNLTRTNVNDKFWVWDPSLDGTGGYVLLTGDGSGNYTPSIVSGYSGSAAAGTVYEDIQSGQAIFVEATAAGAASVTFEEADKVSTNHTQVFRNGTQTEKFRVNLLNAANPAAIKVVDGVLVQYSNSFSNAYGAEDGVKLYNDRENLWVDANGKEYMIEGRKLIDNSDTVKLTTWALQQQAYRLEIIGANFANDANLSAFLKDKFLGTETAISLSGTTEYPFTVTSDNNSKATDRFMVVFRSNASLPVTLTNVKAYQQNAGIAVEWNTQSESGMQQYEVEKSANGTNFVKVNTTAAKSGTANSYNFFDATPFGGANYYRIKAISLNGDVKYSSIVVVRLNTKGTKVTLYPNPVKGDQINLELSGLAKGNYTVSLFNQLGQQVMNRSIQHNGTNATQTINIGTIPSGVYELRLANGTTAVTQKLIKE
jgi:hypothetical protein